MVRRKYIQNLVEGLLSNFSVSENNGPINVKEIAESMGVHVQSSDTKDNVSGFLYRDTNTGAVIGVNSDQNENRQRFTIAHELGHFLLHEGEPFFIDDNFFKINLRDNKSSKGSDTIEIEANYFAAELLMPRLILEKKLESIKNIDVINDEENSPLSEIATSLGVSKQALTYRLANLGYISL